MNSFYKQLNNHAFIDSQNLYLAIKDLGWKLDYKKFRIYLKDKYSIEKAYMFLGYLAENQELYKFLQEADFILIFRPILEKDGNPIKGNCDVDLALHLLINLNNYHQALVVTGDGDFCMLVKHLRENNKLVKVLAPSHKSCSVLLRKAAGNKIAFIEDLKIKLAYKNPLAPLAEPCNRQGKDICSDYKNPLAPLAEPCNRQGKDICSDYKKKSTP